MYDGVVTVGDDQIPVIVAFEGGSIRMSAAGMEIGEWNADDCRISHLSDTTYAITAENETLRFVPNQPTLFATEVNGGRHVGAKPTEVDIVADEPAITLRAGAPPPKTVTLVLFYGLCTLTAGLAVWALISMVLD